MLFFETCKYFVEYFSNFLKIVRFWQKTRGKTTRLPPRTNNDFNYLEFQRCFDGLDFGVGGLHATLVVGCSLERRILHLDVELNLRLGA